MLFRIDTSGKVAEALPPSSFSNLTYHERYDLQEWVLNNPELLGEPLLVITSEFSGFDRTAERLDVLALDRDGRLVVVELKRSAVGTTAELQALRYAAYCSTLRLEDLAEMGAAYRSRRIQSTKAETMLDEVRQFVEAPEFEELDDRPRIILAASEFGPELTATVMWLRSYELDIRCVRLTPYRLGDHLVVDSSVLIPLPEAEEFVIRREKKDSARSSRGRAGRPTLDEFMDAIPDELRPLFVQLRQTLAGKPNTLERVFNGLIAYRRESDRGWITWLTHTKTQVRAAIPESVEIPEEMVVKSRDGWVTLAATDQASVATLVDMLQRYVQQATAEDGPPSATGT
jgi:hypothetical protein